VGKLGGKTGKLAEGVGLAMAVIKDDIDRRLLFWVAINTFVGDIKVGLIAVKEFPSLARLVVISEFFVGLEFHRHHANPPLTCPVTGAGL
jgi:hypothetical protein